MIILHSDALEISEDTIEVMGDDTPVHWTKWEEDKSRQFFKVRNMLKSKKHSICDK